MQINPYGVRGRRLEALVEACQFYAEILLGKRMARGLTIDIEVEKDLDVKGECVNEDCTKRSRYFTIRLQNENINEMVKTLAHEMVHVKQYVRNELGDKIITMKGDNVAVIATMWKGEKWLPGPREHAYYDAPWEVEAFGKEVGLARRFADYWEKING